MICRSEERASKARDGILQRIKEAKLLVDGMSSESLSSKKENGNDKITNNDDVDIRMILVSSLYIPPLLISIIILYRH